MWLNGGERKHGVAVVAVASESAALRTAHKIGPKQKGGWVVWRGGGFGILMRYFGVVGFGERVGHVAMGIEEQAGRGEGSVNGKGIVQEIPLGGGAAGVF